MEGCNPTTKSALIELGSIFHFSVFDMWPTIYALYEHVHMFSTPSYVTPYVHGCLSLQIGASFSRGMCFIYCDFLRM